MKILRLLVLIVIACACSMTSRAGAPAGTTSAVRRSTVGPRYVTGGTATIDVRSARGTSVAAWAARTSMPPSAASARRGSVGIR